MKRKTHFAASFTAALFILLGIGACASQSQSNATAEDSRNAAGEAAVGETSIRAPEAPVRAAADAGASVEQAVASITPEDLYARIAFLASDLLRGRDTPSRELDITASYIVSEFEAMGLEPGGENGGYIQSYPFPLVATSTEGVRLAVVSDEAAPTLNPGRDFIAVAGEPASGQGDLVYVGSNPAADAFRTAAGEVAMVSVTGSPQQRDWRIASSQALRRAQDAGAAALLVVLDANVTDDAVSALAASAERPSRVLGGLSSLPVFYVRHDAAREMLAGAGADPALLDERDPSATARHVEGIAISYSAPPEVVEDATAPNVAGILRGSDPELRDTYVVFSAHMDHVGVGRPDESGDSIYNGADDNGTGTSALIEVAEAFAMLEDAPARSILFLTVSGEEKGLLGSQWFSDHPTVPLESIVANVNIDMIGRNAPDSIVVIGQEYSSLGPLVRGVAADRPELGLTVSEDLWPEQRFFFRSDHYNFARKDIPALFFFAGVHEDYHQPSDHVADIDTDKVSRVARLIFHTAYEMANDPQPPEWSPEGLEEVRSMTR